MGDPIAVRWAAGEADRYVFLGAVADREGMYVARENVAGAADSRYDILMVPKAGGGVEILSTAQGGWLAVDETHLYWSRFDWIGERGLFRMPKVGGAVEVLLDWYPGSIVVDDAFVHGANGVRVAKHGTEPPVETALHASRLWLYGDDLYGLQGGDKVVRAAKSGGEPIVVALTREAVDVALVPQGAVWLEDREWGRGELRMAPHTGAAPIEFPDGPMLNMFFATRGTGVVALTGYYGDDVWWSALWEIDASTRALVELAQFPGVHHQLVVDEDDYYFLKSGSLEWMLEYPGGLRRYSHGEAAPTSLIDGQWIPMDLIGDDENLYWTNTGYSEGFIEGEVVSIPKSGGAKTVLATGDFDPTYLALAGDVVYFTSRYEGTVRSVPKEGGAVQIEHSGVEPRGIDSDGGALFWADSGDGTIVRRELPAGPTLVLAAGQPEPRNVVVRGEHVYWYNYGGGDLGDSIMRVHKDGGEYERVVERADWVTGIGVDEQYVYYGNAAADRLYAAPVSGEAVSTVLEAGLSGARALVADGPVVYYAEGNTIRSRHIESEFTQTVVVLDHEPTRLFVDDDGLYWIGSLSTIGCLPRGQL